MLIRSQDGTIVLNADNTVFYIDLIDANSAIIMGKQRDINYPLSEQMTFKEAQAELARILNYYEHNKRVLTICQLG